LSCFRLGGQLDYLHCVRKLAVHFHNRGCSGRGSPGLPPESSLCADLLWSTELPLLSAATSSTPFVLSGPRSPVMKPCACRLVNSNSSIIERSRSSSSVPSLFALFLAPKTVLVPSQIPTNQSLSLQANTSPLYTSNSGPVAPVISC
jgi:hypothetical protein